MAEHPQPSAAVHFDRHDARRRVMRSHAPVAAHLEQAGGLGCSPHRAGGIPRQVQHAIVARAARPGQPEPAGLAAVLGEERERAVVAQQEPAWRSLDHSRHLVLRKAVALVEGQEAAGADPREPA